jgi:hypothetical protein
MKRPRKLCITDSSKIVLILVQHTCSVNISLILLGLNTLKKGPKMYAIVKLYLFVSSTRFFKGKAGHCETLHKVH